MKKPEDILDKELKALNPDDFIALYFKIHREIILKLFKDIQTEAFNEAIELAAEKAELTNWVGNNTYDASRQVVCKQSILKLKI